ncbi:hypothetical protein MOO44_00915 (plasmid) [Nicoliella spurrieriana]|uniref:Uncharacterized protein n=1 Tax=Nicoliella spurrieriana TaxID=2925830 RepID=A0A976RQS4_9LACO|nr:hypothetical protein MOO44_00915 [Nicoliella spurrieriana]
MFDEQSIVSASNESFRCGYYHKDGPLMSKKTGLSATAACIVLVTSSSVISLPTI